MKKILLIMPDAHMHKLRFGPYLRSSREAPLTLTTLAALVPDDLGINVKLVDGSIDQIPMDYPADLVGISAITGCARYAYEIADHFRKRSIPVVLGGTHVTILPEEAKHHADVIVIGMAERTWPQLLRDFCTGQIKPVYEDPEPPDSILEAVPAPRRALQRNSGYMIPNTVQATRGCKRTCDFCTVPVVWPKYLTRPVADVIRDIKAVKSRYFAFNDVSLIDDLEYAKELFTAMIPLRKKWGGLVTTEVIQHPELLELMARSGCAYLLLGFETLNQSSLYKIHKGFNKSVDYKEITAHLHSLGISVQGCFVFGFDQDDKSVFESTVQRVIDLKVDIPRYSIYTPFPGTDLFKRLLAEDRIISFNWNDYDTMHVVYQPAQLSPEELYTGFKWAYKQTFTLGNIASRLPGLTLTSAINFVGNLTYRIFVKRLYKEERFARPYTIDDPGTWPSNQDHSDLAAKSI